MLLISHHALLAFVGIVVSASTWVVCHRTSQLAVYALLLAARVCYLLLIPRFNNRLLPSFFFFFCLPAICIQLEVACAEVDAIVSSACQFISCVFQFTALASHDCQA